MSDIRDNWSTSHKTAPRTSVAVGAAVRKENTVLFIRQTYGIYKGLWCFPTGFVNLGERPDRAALRETQEEAGIAASLDGLLSVSMIDWEGDVQLYIVFSCQHHSGKPIPDGVECDGAAYLTWSDLESLPVEPLCKELAQRILQGEARTLPEVDSAALEVITTYA